MNNLLTKKQKEVFEQICNYIDEYGYSPTVRELCDLCGLSSSATMWVHLQKLKKKGFIYFDDYKPRTIRTNLHDDLEQKYIELQQRINKAIEYGKSCINEDLDVDKLDEEYKDTFKIAYEIHNHYLEILGSDNNV